MNRPIARLIRIPFYDTASFPPEADLFSDENAAFWAAPAAGKNKYYETFEKIH